MLENEHVDFFSLARPLIREPDLPNQLKNGRVGEFDCVSCNICFLHEGIHGTKCWRKKLKFIFQHIYLKIFSKLKIS